MMSKERGNKDLLLIRKAFNPGNAVKSLKLAVVKHSEVHQIWPTIHLVVARWGGLDTFPDLLGWEMTSHDGQDERW